MSKSEQTSDSQKKTIPKSIRFLFGGGAGYFDATDNEYKSTIFILLDVQNAGHLFFPTIRSYQEYDAIEW